MPPLLAAARVTVYWTVSPGRNAELLGLKLSVLPLTVAGVGPCVRRPPRWLLNTCRAPAEPGASGWLKRTKTGLVATTARALAAGEREVIAGA